jgi:predicted DNA-binding transcriptional regulator AlpA
MSKPTSVEPIAYGVPQFCKAVGISERTFWSMKQAGTAPPVCRVGKRVLIRRAAAEQWLLDREAA